MLPFTAWLPGQEGGNSVSDILVEMVTMTIPYENLASFNEQQASGRLRAVSTQLWLPRTQPT